MDFKGWNAVEIMWYIFAPEKEQEKIITMVKERLEKCVKSN